jgi:hypothetical protein
LRHAQDSATRRAALQFVRLIDADFAPRAGALRALIVIVTEHSAHPHLEELDCNRPAASA